MAAIVGVGILVWYLYQVGSRKQERIRYKTKRIIVALFVYLVAALVLARQGLPPLEVVFVSGLAGLGCAWLLVNPPKRERRIAKHTRREVIARDLTSKGLKWDPSRHHIDHVVPFSRGGDHSTRNLRVVEKQENLRKGGRMPSFWDFLKK
jgi:hypothetical protein